VSSNDDLARLDRLRREREALEASYADFKSELAAERTPPSDPDERIEALSALIRRLVTYVEMEREQSAVLFELLVHAYQRAVDDG
jgi:hypothetical protein